MVTNWNSAAALWCVSNMFKKKNQVIPNLSYLSEVTAAGWFSLSLELLDCVEGALAGFWAFLTGVNGLVDGRLFTQGGEVFSDRLPQPELPEPNREPRGENLRALRGERQGPGDGEACVISFICRARSLLCGGVASGLDSVGGRRWFSLLAEIKENNCHNNLLNFAFRGQFV